MAPPPLTLHPLGLNDAPALQTVYSGGADYFVQATGAPPDAGRGAQVLAEAAGDDARHILGVYLNDEIVGAIDFRFANVEPEVHIGLILLAEPYRRQGIGRWALSILEEWLRKATPAEAVVLAVAAQNYAAQGFFRSQGYAFTGQAMRVPAGDVQSRLLFMRKQLSLAAQ